MPFSNSIAGGNGQLVRNQLISPNYVAGVSGWRIGQDGTVEFNNGTFRGSLTSGNPAAAHIVLNNGSTGDAVDVYDATNKLVYNITNTGLATSYYRGGGVNQNTLVEMGAGQIIFDRVTPGPNASNILYEPDTGGGGQSADLHMQVQSYGAGETLVIDFLSGAFNGINGATILVTARGVTGSLVQSDQTRTNNLTRVVAVTFTTNGAGDGSFNPGLSFTPNLCLATPSALAFTVPGTQILIWRDVLTAANCAFRVFSPGGAAFVGTMTAYFAFYG